MMVGVHQWIGEFGARSQSRGPCVAESQDGVGQKFSDAMVDWRQSEVENRQLRRRSFGGEVGVMAVVRRWSTLSLVRDSLPHQLR